MDHPENSSEYAGLQVNSGVEQPSIINPYLKRGRVKRRELSAAEMVEGITKGDVTILSQAVTLVESVNPDHQAKAQEVINKCLPYSGNSIRVGISGVPGAGKSTSIDEFGIHVLKEKGGKLAVLAIDPSSERSKGSILGDKTRMEKLSVHPDSFIRPSPTAGSLGGVARKTRETIVLCEAAGFDKIFVETVGVGQSETACHYKMLDKCPEKKQIALAFGVGNEDVFANWLHAFSNLRNCCAHHSRIWNRRFVVNLKLAYNTSRPFLLTQNTTAIKQNKLFALLSAIKYVVDILSPGNSFKQNLTVLLNDQHRLLKLKEMGFPLDWQDLPVWKK